MADSDSQRDADTVEGSGHSSGERVVSISRARFAANYAPRVSVVRQGSAGSRVTTYGRAMKHMTLADKSVLLGDEVADLLADYARLLAQENTADTIEIHGISGDGDEVTITFLLNSGVTLLLETTTSTLPEPENAKAEEYLRSTIVELTARTSPPFTDPGASVWNQDSEES